MKPAHMPSFALGPLLVSFGFPFAVAVCAEVAHA